VWRLPWNRRLPTPAPMVKAVGDGPSLAGLADQLVAVVRKTSQKLDSPEISVIGSTVCRGCRGRWAQKLGVGDGANQAKIQSEGWANEFQILCPLNGVDGSVEAGRRPRSGQVGTGLGLGVSLTPADFGPAAAEEASPLSPADTSPESLRDPRPAPFPCPPLNALECGSILNV
jgi:hypothetical protein